MAERDHRLTEPEIIDRLKQAEEDEAAGRLVDGDELIARLRRAADELEQRVALRRA